MSQKSLPERVNPWLDTVKHVAPWVVPVLMGVGTAIWAGVKTLPGPVVFVLGLFALALSLWVVSLVRGLRGAKGTVVGARPQVQGTPDKKHIYNRRFEHETVRLDDHHYNVCEFIHCTLEIGDSPGNVVGCTIAGTTRVRMLTRSAFRAMQVLESLGYFRKGVTVNFEQGGAPGLPKDLPKK